MKTFWFESKKVCKKKSVLFAFLLSALAAISLYFFNYSVAEDIYQGNITKLKKDVTRIDGYINNFKKEKELAQETGDSETVTEITTIIDGYERNKELKEVRIKAYEQEDWATITEGEINDITFLFEAGAGSMTPPMSIEEQDTSWFTFRATLEEKKLLFENEVIPFIQNTTDVGFLPTLYDNFTGKSLESWESMTTRYGTTGFTFIYQLIHFLYIPIVVLIGCFIFGNSISSESGKKKRGLQFFAVLPFRIGNLYIAKYASGLLYTLGFTLIMLIIPVLCSLLTDGVGSLSYPVLVYDGPEPNPYGDEFTTLNPMEDTFHFITLKEYLGFVLLFAVLFVFFLYSMYFVISLFIRNPGVAMVIAGIIIFAGMNANQNAYNPFTYVDIHQIITGEKMTVNLNTAIKYETGLLLFVATGLLMTYIGYFRFRFRKWSK